MRRIERVGRLAAAALALLAGCGDDPSAVAIRWSMDGMACAEAGVKTVHVFIGPLGNGSYDYDVDCELGEKGTVLPSVGPGRRTMVLKGFGNEVTKYTLTVEVDVPVGGGDLGTFALEPVQNP